MTTFIHTIVHIWYPTTTSGMAAKPPRTKFAIHSQKFRLLILVIANLIFGLIPNLSRADSTPIRAKHGMVASSSEVASQVGVEIMKKGGNAVDAAVAVGLALAVTHPAAGNIGGGGFMLVRMADGRCVAIDFRETAPASSTREMYLDEKGSIVPEASLVGPYSAAVPGTVAGLALAL